MDVSHPFNGLYKQQYIPVMIQARWVLYTCAGVAQLGEQQTEVDNPCILCAFWRSRVQSTVLAFLLALVLHFVPLTDCQCLSFYH
jgi:hypothetical protein